MGEDMIKKTGKIYLDTKPFSNVLKKIYKFKNKKCISLHRFEELFEFVPKRTKSGTIIILKPTKELKLLLDDSKIDEWVKMEVLKPLE